MQMLTRRLLAATALAAVVAGPGAAEMAAPGSAERPLRLYMIQWRGETDTDRGFVEYFAQQGISAEFVIRNVDRDPGNIPGFVAEINALRPDLVYTWGGAAPPLVVGRHGSVSATDHVTDIPVVTCMVADPVELGVVPSWESSGRNVTGTSHVAPLDVQVRGMLAYGPLHHLAVIYNTTEPGPGIVVEKLRELAAQFDFRLSALAVPLTPDGRADADALPELVAEAGRLGADFLYLGPDSFLGANRDIVTRAARAHRVATFVSSEVYLKDSDALAGVVSPYYNMGQFCAYKAEQILVHGVPPAEVPFETLKRFSYMINIDTAVGVGHVPPITLLNIAEVLHDE